MGRKNNKTKELLTIDIREKQAQLHELFLDVYDVCRVTISAVKEGKMELKASLLKEVIAFLKTAKGMIADLEAFQAGAQTEDAAAKYCEDEGAQILKEFEESMATSEWSDSYDPMSLPLD